MTSGRGQKTLASPWKREEMAHPNVLHDPCWSLDADWSGQDQHHHFNLECLGALEDIHNIWIKVGPNQAHQKKAASSSEQDLGVKHKTNSTTKGVQCNYWARTRPRTNTTNEMNKRSARRENKVKSKRKREKDE
jgi:hypothetical protein